MIARGYVSGLTAASLSLVLLLPFGSAGQQRAPPGETDKPLRFAPGENTGLQGPYLGQEPPGLTPVLFAPGIISVAGHYEMDLSFSRDGKECYVGRDGHMLVAKLERDGWTTPVAAPFRFGLYGPKVLTSVDGERMILSGPEGLAVSRKTENGWTQPEFLMPGMGMSIADNGTVYTSWLDEPTREWRLFRSVYVKGTYGQPEEVLLSIYSESSEASVRFAATHPQVAPDESFILFESNIPGGYGDTDYYVTFHTADGTWSDPVNLGPEVNSPDQNARARLTPDGEYVLFNRFGDIYWVSVQYVRNLDTQRTLSVTGVGLLKGAAVEELTDHRASSRCALDRIGSGPNGPFGDAFPRRSTG